MDSETSRNTNKKTLAADKAARVSFGESVTSSRFGKDIAHARIYFCLLLLGLSRIVRFSLLLSSRGIRILRLK